MNEKRSVSFGWNKAKRRAAAMLATDELPNAAIAKRVGVTERALDYWKANPVFHDEVKRLTDAVAEKVLAFGIARLEHRVAAQNDRWYRMRQVIADRAADPAMVAIPGGPTGLLVRTIKVIGQGPYAQTVEEYAVDTGLLRELREHEKQAAQELGQWTEKRESRVQSTIAVNVHDDRAFDFAGFAGLFARFTDGADGPGGGPAPLNGAAESVYPALPDAAPGALPDDSGA
jgi:hypothetical protein